jgi:hypothetical protein
MQRKLKSLLLVTLLFFVCDLAYSQTTKDSVQQVVRNFFDAFSSGKFSDIETCITSDIKVLEGGKVWNGDTLRAILSKPRPADFKRLNMLEFFQTESRSRMAFVSYYNFADIYANGNRRMVQWLESAVLVNEKGVWKIKQLHSTRLEPRAN